MKIGEYADKFTMSYVVMENQKTEWMLLLILTLKMQLKTELD